VIGLYHGGPCGHSAAVLIALAEKRIPYDERVIDLAGFGQFEPDFLKVNPVGQVPVLENDQGELLTESFPILLWLDEAHSVPPLGGGDASVRDEVRKWGKYIETHIAPNLATWRWARSAAQSPPAELLARLPRDRRALWERAAAGFSSEEVARARLALERAGERMAADIADGGWLAGDNYSLADIAAYPHIAQFEELGIAVPELVEEWLTRIAIRPAVREAVGELVTVATMGPEPQRWG
jgi:glutathione S-transferase